MARRVQLSILRSNIRDRGEWNTSYFTNDMLTAFINVSCAKFYSMMSALDPMRYLKQHKFKTVEGTREYDLAGDTFKVFGVCMGGIGETTIDGYNVLDQFRYDERCDGYWESQTDLGTLRSMRYLPKGVAVTDEADAYQNAASWGHPRIEFQPTPTLNAYVIVDYIPTLVEMTGDGYAFDTINALGEEWIVNDVCIMCCAKEETDPSTYVALKQEAEKVLTANSQYDIVPKQAVSSASNLRELRICIRNRGDWGYKDISDAQMTEWINSSIAAFVDLIVQYDPGTFLEYEDVNVEHTRREYPLPSDFYKLVGVAIADSSATDGYYTMDRAQWEERYDSATSTKLSTRYMLRGNNIIFQPTPTWDGVVRLEYIPKPDSLTQPTEEFNFYNHWQEWIILDVCLKCCAYMKLPADIYIAQLQKTEVRIIAETNRDNARPVQFVSMCRGGTSGRNWRYGRNWWLPDN